MSDEQPGEIRVVDDAPVASGPRRVIPDEPGFLRKNFRAFIWGFVLVLLAVFIGQNWNKVRIEVFFWDFNIELSWALIAAAALGVLLGWLVPKALNRRKRER